MRRLLPRFADPGRFALKAAARAAIVIPCVFGFAMGVIDNVDTSTYAAFGCFSILVLADFGGAWRPRLGAYLVLALCGVAFIALGTLCSRDPWLAAGAMAVLGFLVIFSGAAGGYFAAGGGAPPLALILPGSPPPAPATPPDRPLGRAAR